MNKSILILCFLTLISVKNFGQSTNSSNLLREGHDKRQERIDTKNKLDKQNYWLGKVPVKDGLVTFEHTVNIPGKSKEQVYDLMLSFAEQLVENSGHPELSQITVKEQKQGKIICSLQETMYFKRSKWETDFTEFYYLLTIDCQNGSCNITINNIQYRYEEQHEVQSGYFKAEEWITDDVAFNKQKTKFRKESGKFRRETIKRANDIFASADKYDKK